MAERTCSLSKEEKIARLDEFILSLKKNSENTQQKCVQSETLNNSNETEENLHLNDNKMISIGSISENSGCSEVLVSRTPRRLESSNLKNYYRVIKNSNVTVNKATEVHQIDTNKTTFKRNPSPARSDSIDQLRNIILKLKATKNSIDKENNDTSLNKSGQKQGKVKELTTYKNKSVKMTQRLTFLPAKEHSSCSNKQKVNAISETSTSTSELSESVRVNKSNISNIQKNVKEKSLNQKQSEVISKTLKNVTNISEVQLSQKSSEEVSKKMENLHNISELQPKNAFSKVFQKLLQQTSLAQANPRGEFKEQSRGKRALDQNELPSELAKKPKKSPQERKLLPPGASTSTCNKTTSLMSSQQKFKINKSEIGIRKGMDYSKKEMHQTSLKLFTSHQKCVRKANTSAIVTQFPSNRSFSIGSNCTIKKEIINMPFKKILDSNSVENLPQTSKKSATSSDILFPTPKTSAALPKFPETQSRGNNSPNDSNKVICQLLKIFSSPQKFVSEGNPNKVVEGKSIENSRGESIVLASKTINLPFKKVTSPYNREKLPGASDKSAAPLPHETNIANSLTQKILQISSVSSTHTLLAQKHQIQSSFQEKNMGDTTQYSVLSANSKEKLKIQNSKSEVATIFSAQQEHEGQTSGIKPKEFSNCHVKGANFLENKRNISASHLDKTINENLITFRRNRSNSFSNSSNCLQKNVNTTNEDFGAGISKKPDDTVFARTYLEIPSRDSAENSPDLLFSAPGSENQRQRNLIGSRNQQTAKKENQILSDVIISNTNSQKDNSSNLNPETHRMPPFFLVPMPLSQEKKRRFKYETGSSVSCSEIPNFPISKIYPVNLPFTKGQNESLTKETSLVRESEKHTSSSDNLSQNMSQFCRPPFSLSQKGCQEPARDFNSSSKSTSSSEKYLSQSQQTPYFKTYTQTTNSESHISTEPKPVIKNWLDDEIVNKILTKNYNRCHELHTPEIRIDKILQTLSQKKLDKTSSKNTYVKRYRKGLGKIYKLKRMKKRNTKPQNSQKQLTCEDVLMTLQQNFYGINTQKSDPSSYEVTNSSYETDITVSQVSSSSSLDLQKPQARLRKALKEISKEKSLLYSCGSFDEYTRVEIKENIEQILLRVYEDLKNTGKCVLKYRRQVIENCVFEDERLQFKPFSQTMMTEINSSHPRSQTNFKLFLIILSKIQCLLETNTKTTKRQIFYQLQDITRNQRITDNIINNISCLLNVGMWELNIVAQKGLVYGNLELLMSSGDKINCNERGMLIPANISEISEIHSSAYFILVVEKETIFQKLIDEDLPNKLTRPFILITGKGFPDLNTQLFLRKLWMVMSKPVFILVDPDPHGINIMLTYRFGSVSNAHVSHQLTVPKARWLGVYPSEIQSFNIERRPLKNRDLRMVDQLLKLPYIKNNPKIGEELHVFIEKGFKASIEGLFKTNFYLSSVYLERKFVSHDFI